MKSFARAAAFALAFSLALPAVRAQDPEDPLAEPKPEAPKPEPKPEAKPEKKPEAGEGDKPAEPKPEGEKGEKGEKPAKPAKPPKPGKGEKTEKDENDLGSLEQKTLASKLHVTPGWDSETSTVEVMYGFGQEEELLDWKITGADRADLTSPAAGPRAGAKGGGGGKGGRGGPPMKDEKGGLRLSAGSEALATAVLEPLELKGDFTIEATVRLAQFGPSAELVFLFGVRGAEGHGLRFGDQLVKVRGAAFQAITKNEPARDKFAPRQPVNVKIVRAGDELTASLNGVKVFSKKLTAKELDGKIGLMGGQNARVVVEKLHLKGVIDRSKL